MEQIEHPLFSATITSTTTGTGLAVHTELDTGTCPTGAQITGEQTAALRCAATSATATELHRAGHNPRPARTRCATLAELTAYTAQA